MNRRTFIEALGVAGTGLALGPRCLLAQAAVAAVPTYSLYGYTHRVDIERGLKFHCLVPRMAKDLYGAFEYAGFLTTSVGDEPWVFVGDQPPEQSGVPATLADLRVCSPTLRRETAAYTVVHLAMWNALYPVTRLSTTVHLGAESEVTGALLGWRWAERTAPTVWTADGAPRQRAEGAELRLPPGCTTLTFADEHGPFTGVLHFPNAPQRAWVDDDGLYWSWGRVAPGNDVLLRGPDYGLAPGRLAPAQVEALLAAAEEGWTDSSPRLLPGETPAWEVRGGGRGVPVPPPLAPLVTDRAKATAIPSAAGDLLIVRGKECSVPLPVPAELERPVPPKTMVSAEVLREVSRHAEDVLAHRTPDGRFSFSEGRTFYDGFVCAALSQVAPLLDPPLRDEAARVVRACLDFLCANHVRSKAYNLLVPPEQPGFIESAIDYPEITSCLLYAMLAYALNFDREYPRRWAELIQTHLGQISDMTSPCGTAYAAAAASRLHIIAESAYGGYLAWASMYHLGRLANGKWTAEARARAALAWAGYRELFRWRPEFGDRDVVNGWWDWCAQVRTPEPWAYVQSTWFSFIPLIPYEHEDRYGLWRSLRAQPWWDYTNGPPPRQRAYDYANALALARAGYADEVKAHWREVNSRPFSWETYDFTPALALAALPQLAALGALP